MFNYPETWNQFFQEVKKKEYSKALNQFLDKEYSAYTCYPPRKLLFNAFNLTPLENVKVVIIGQDPYHEPEQAMGLSFSVPKGIRVPPSLINIYKEIENEYRTELDMTCGDLTYLAKQGVLLLNSILSVRAHQALSHNIPEYQLFLKDVLEAIDHQPQPIVFMLWGGPARKLKQFLRNPTHLILECIHPSPLAANHGGWFGNNHFALANDYLIKNQTNPIKWIPERGNMQ
ncbi:MAG TPA: uracil-DNA glycosylase [Bacilli bacterium]|nr:uracil-DNA glycosylase [Bacilli bacterium]HPS19007.1 uracil-DNA glycosylase [Bacilli bacterium]